MHLSRKTCHIFHLHYQGKLVASVYSQQVFLDKGTCQGKLASVNEALKLKINAQKQSGNGILKRNPETESGKGTRKGQIYE